MKYYIIAGEASGDLHGSNLIHELKLLDSAAQIRCWGGDKMQDAGAILVKHYSELAFMGFIEVLKNLRTIFKNLANCKADIIQYQPDVLVLIDYPGFNLRIASWAKQKGLRVIYYISPQVWAWKESRVNGIKKNVDKMLVILPFEKDFYKKWDFEVEYVGHPLVKVVDDFKVSHSHLETAISSDEISFSEPQVKRSIIAILPGSRKQEILTKLPIMLSVAKHFPEFHFVVAKAPGIEDDFYESMLSPYQNVSSVINQTYELLRVAKAALVTSGTATLETALFGVPEVVCYKGSAISFQIAKWLITIKYICLVNLIMKREVVKELIQEQLTENNLSNELKKILYDVDKQLQMKEDYVALKNLLSQGGNASANAASSIYFFYNHKRSPLMQRIP